MTRVFSIDAEYHTPMHLQTEKFTVIYYKWVLMGVYDVQNDNYDYLIFNYDNFNSYEDYMHHISHSILKHLFGKLQDKEGARVYSFFLSAEMQFIFYALAEKSKFTLIDDSEKFKHFKLENEKYVTEVMYSDRPLFIKITKRSTEKTLTFVDIQKLTNATTLEALVEGMGISNEQYHQYKIQRKDIKQMSTEEIINYNRLDCTLQYKALVKFNEYLLKLLNPEYTSKINSLLEGVTMGSYLVKYFHQYNDELKRYYELMHQEFYTLEDIDLLEKYQQYRRLFYYGGGINHNLLQFNTTLKDVYMVDFNSLYPISMVIALRKLPSKIEDIKHLTNEKHELDDLGINISVNLNELITKLSNNDNYYYFVKCKLRVNDSSLVCENVKQENTVIDTFQADTDREVMSRNVICKNMTVVLSKDEFVLEMQENNLEQCEILELWYWKVDKDSWDKLYTDTCALILKRLELKKQKDASVEANALQYILKILLNSLYGKFAEKRVTRLTYPILASLITAISRYIMRKIAYTLKKHNVQVYHFATDSIICSNFDYSMINKMHNEITQYIAVDKIMSVEIEPSAASVCRVIRHKIYAFFDNNNEIVKEAHHAIHLNRNNKKSEMKRLFATLDEGKRVLHFIREGWVKYDDIDSDIEYIKYFCMQRYELNVSALVGDLKVKADNSKYEFSKEFLTARKAQDRTKNRMKREYLVNLCLDAYRNNKVSELTLYAPKLLQDNITARALKGEYKTTKTKMRNNRRVRLSEKEQKEHDELISQVMQYIRERGEAEVNELKKKFSLNNNELKELYAKGYKHSRKWIGNKKVMLISPFSPYEQVDQAGNKVPPIL